MSDIRGVDPQGRPRDVAVTFEGSLLTEASRKISPFPLHTDVAAAGDGAILVLNGASYVLLSVSGTSTDVSFAFKAAPENRRSDFLAVLGTRTSTLLAATAVANTDVSTAQQYLVDVRGYQHFICDVTAIANGNITVRAYKLPDGSPLTVSVKEAVSTGVLVAAANASGIEVQGATTEDAAAAGNPVLVGGRYDATPRDLDDGDVGAAALDADGNIIVVGNVADGSAAIGAPVPIAGKDGSGNIQAILTDTDGKIELAATVTGSNNIQDDAGNNNTQAKGDDFGNQYVKQVGQESSKGESILVHAPVTGTLTTATQLTAEPYLCDDVVVAFRNRNTDSEGLIGDSQTQAMEVLKGTPVRLGPIDPREVYLKAHTTAADDADGLLTLRDRPGFRQLILDTILKQDNRNAGFYLPFDERSGTAIADRGYWQADFTLSGATVGKASEFGLGIDFDGTNDYLVQKTEDSEQGTVGGTETDGSALLSDDGQDFSDWDAPNGDDAYYWIQVTDAGGDKVHGYMGAQGGGGSTEIKVYSEATLDTQNWVEGGSTAFDMADTPLTYKVFRVVKPTTKLTVGAWIENDGLANGVIVGDRSGEATNLASFQLRANTNGTYSLKVFTAAGADITAASSEHTYKVNRRDFVVGTYDGDAATPIISIYVNGRLMATTTASVPASTNPSWNAIEIGRRASPDLYFNGRLGHVFVIPNFAVDANWVETAYALSAR